MPTPTPRGYAVRLTWPSGRVRYRGPNNFRSFEDPGLIRRPWKTEAGAWRHLLGRTASCGCDRPPISEGAFWGRKGAVCDVIPID